MPERRQRAIPKVSGRFKVAANETSECEEHGEDDDDAAINTFIEASCYNLRQLIRKSLGKPDVNPSTNMNCEKIKNSKDHKPRRTAEDLVVVSVVLNREQKDNNEVLLAIERLRRNGVTCAFFTMDDKHSSNSKQIKPANGLVSSTSLISAAMDEKLFNVPPFLCNSQSQLQTQTNNCSRLINNAHSATPIPAHVSNHFEDARKHEPQMKNDIPQSVKNSSTSQPKSALVIEETATSKVHPQLNHCSKLGVKSIAATRKYSRKRKRKSKIGRIPKHQAKRTNVFRKIEKSTAKKSIKENDQQHHESNGTHGAASPKTNQIQKTQGVPATATTAAEISSDISSESKAANLVHKLMAPEGEIIINGTIKQNSKASKKDTQTRSTTLVKQQIKAESFEQSLAKFCLGDRATKSIAAERIRKCLTDDTKKLTKPNQTPPNTSPASDSPLLPDVSKRKPRPSTKSEIDVGQTETACTPNPKPKEIEVKEVSKAREVSPDISEPPPGLNQGPSLRKSRNEYHPKKRKRQCRYSLSPDIVTLAAPSEKQKLKKASEKPIIKKIDSTDLSSNSVKTNEIKITAPPSAPPDPDGEEQKRLEAEVQKVLDDLIGQVVLQNDIESKINAKVVGSLANSPKTLLLQDQTDGTPLQQAETVVVSTKIPPHIICSEDSLPDSDVMQLRRSSFYSLISGNVRTNMENYLDGRHKAVSEGDKRRRRTVKNGFLLHHGDNCPEDPESPYKFHLATQVLLKLNKRRSKCSLKEERTKNVLSYLKLIPKRSGRIPKAQQCKTQEPPDKRIESTFSGDWTFPRKYICGVCSQVEHSFWDMVTHKGENHPGAVVTHVELPNIQEPPRSLIREGPSSDVDSHVVNSLTCTKCSATFNLLGELHKHIFECAGNSSWLVEKVSCKRKSRRRRGFKRRFSNTPKKPKKVETPKKVGCQPLKCTFCAKEFKTEGWLKNHVYTHSLPVSIPLDKLPLPLLPPGRAYLRKCK